MARSYATLGYAAIVPALYSRDGFLTVVEHSDMDLAPYPYPPRPSIDRGSRSTVPAAS